MISAIRLDSLLLALYISVLVLVVAVGIGALLSNLLHYEQAKAAL